MLSMGKSTISMAIFNSYVSLPEGIWCYFGDFPQEKIWRYHEVPQNWKKIVDDQWECQHADRDGLK